MADTNRTLTELLNLFENNVSKDISPQDTRDLIVSLYTGFGVYDDQASKLVPVAGIGSTDPADATLITIDALGSNTKETRLPPNVVGPNALWDKVNNRIDFSQLKEDDLITFRLDFTITTVGSNAELDLLIDVYDNVPDLIETRLLAIGAIKFASTKSIFIVLPLFKDTAVFPGAMGFRILCSNNFTVKFGSMLVRVDR